jgi:hypothetical protein
MISVLALGTSSPDSMIVVQTSTSNSRSQKRTMIRSSCRSSICPCATSTLASGTISAMPAATRWIELTWLCT